MARMFPDPIQPETESAAERLLYERFREALDDDYRVFHSVAWQGLDREHRAKDGEADFVVVHPERGVLVLEAKGGTIRHDPAIGAWSSVSGSGMARQIKDPFAQARRSMYALRDQLETMLRAEARGVFAHGVAFPDHVIDPAELAPDQPRAIILDAEDLGRLPTAVGRIFAHYRGERTIHETHPAPELINALSDLLGKQQEFRPALWGQILHEQRKLMQLTQEQYRLLDLLQYHRRAGICGCAGSGKTLLAAEKATRLARQGFRVLLACFNLGLGAFLRSRLLPCPNMDVFPFLELCEQWVREAGIPVDASDHRRYYDELLPDAMLEALARRPDRYDAIIVDEGQDFKDAWWVILQCLLHDSVDSVMYVFFDSNQAIYPHAGRIPLSDPPYPLTVNCRNTRSIQQAVRHFSAAPIEAPADCPEGRPVELVEYSGGEDLRARVLDLLRRLTREDRIPPEHIAVLTLTRWKYSPLAGLATHPEFPLVESLDPPSGRVLCASVHKFKGLEREVVILAGLDDKSTQDSHAAAVSKAPKDRATPAGEPVSDSAMRSEELLYVGLSRACNHLILIVKESAMPHWRQLLAR